MGQLWNPASQQSRRRHYRRRLLSPPPPRSPPYFRTSLAKTSSPFDPAHRDALAHSHASRTSRKSAFIANHASSFYEKSSWTEAVSLCSMLDSDPRPTPPAESARVPADCARVVGSGNHLLLGGLAIAAKLVTILVTRAFWAKSWPFLQAISLSTFLIRKRSNEIKVTGIFLEPLCSLAGPVIWTTISQHVLKWCWPDAYRTLRFWRHLLPIYAGYMKTKLEVRKKSREERDQAWGLRHEWGGKKVYELILDMSGFYVKSAQILASKADFVPEAWTKHLVKLLDRAPPRPFHEVERNIREQLPMCPLEGLLSGKNRLVPLDAVFWEVETVPLASASIAQVHAGTLKKGMQVVIKVQHKGMDVLMSSDLRNIAWLAKFLRGQLPVDLVPIVKEIQSTIPLEFDFEREVWFMNTIKKNLEDNGFEQIVCPAPVMELCSKRLIVMQRIDGVPFSQILNSSDLNLQSRIPEAINAVEHLIRAYGQMFFVDGVFHADPHAGNLFLLSDGRLGLLDYGQSKQIDRTLRQKLARMTLALCGGNDFSIALALLDIDMVFQPTDGIHVPLSTVATAARILFDVCYVEEANVSPMAQDSILRLIPLKKFNQALWLVVRTNLLLRGLCHSLKLDISASSIWKPYALTAVKSL